MTKCDINMKYRLEISCVCFKLAVVLKAKPTQNIESLLIAMIWLDIFNSPCE